MKNEIGKLYIELNEEYSFYAPIKENGNLVFKKVLNTDDIVLDYFNSKVPPKEVLFPKMEVLFEYKTDGKNVTEIIEREVPEEKKIIFGIRPCDAHAIKLMEDFFGFGEFKDELFLKKKNNSILIGIGCNSPKTTCFCTSVGGHPFQKDYLDIFLVDIGEKYLVEMISEKGKNLIKKLSWLKNATKKDINLT